MGDHSASADVREDRFPPVVSGLAPPVPRRTRGRRPPCDGYVPPRVHRDGEGHGSGSVNGAADHDRIPRRHSHRAVGDRNLVRQAGAAAAPRVGDDPRTCGRYRRGCGPRHRGPAHRPVLPGSGGSVRHGAGQSGHRGPSARRRRGPSPQPRHGHPGHSPRTGPHLRRRARRHDRLARHPRARRGIHRRPPRPRPRMRARDPFLRSAQLGGACAPSSTVAGHWAATDSSYA